MTPETIAKLEQAFLMGCSDLEACLYADITKSTLYRYQEEHPEFCDRKETLKENPVMLSRKVLLDALHDGDRLTAHKIIERKEGTKVKQEITGADGGAIDSKLTIEFVTVENKTSK